MLATWGTSTGFNPASLFAGGEQGAWYDPSDNLTMYDTAGGAVQITAVEQAVGLILDKSKGLAIGSDVLSGVWLNAYTTTFDTFTSTSSGGFTGTTTGAKSPRVRCAGSISPGLWYQVTFTVETLTNASLTVWLANDYSANSVASSGTISSVGTYTRILGTASTSAVTSLAVLVTATGAATVTLSGITVKPLAGNHAYQTTSASRPTLRARYNLLTYSEDFGNAVWTTASATVQTNQTTAPDGTLTADKIISNAATAQTGVTQSVAFLAASYTSSFYAKASEVRYVQLLWTSTRSTDYANFDLVDGVVTASSGGTATISSIGSGWYRLTLTSTLSAGTGVAACYLQNSGTAARAASFVGNGTDGVFLWGAQLVPTAVFPSNVYQRIAAATDYATGAAFPQYLAFDGTDDSLLTTSVDFTGTDKMTVFSGLSKLTDSSAGACVVEQGANASLNAGFFIFAPANASQPEYGIAARGSAANRRVYTTYTAPITNVLATSLSSEAANSAAAISTKINGSSVAGTDSLSNTSTGTFPNAALFIGRRNNATSPLNGRIYSLIIRGAASNTTQVAQTERYVASKTPLGVVP